MFVMNQGRLFVSSKWTLTSYSFKYPFVFVRVCFIVYWGGKTRLFSDSAITIHPAFMV